MTPSVSLTVEGWIRGLQAEMLAIIGVVLGIIVVRWVILSLMLKVRPVGNAPGEGRNRIRGLVNWGAGIAFVLALAGFGWNAAIFGTNAIPRSDIDKSSVYQQMDFNIKR